MAVIGVNYNEETLKYESVYLFVNDNKIFKSDGNFIKDWYQAMKHFILGNFNEPLSFSSSVNHFISDTKIYDSGYLKFKDDGKPYLSYEFDRENEGLEFFVPNNKTPTWEELKNILENK